MPVEFLSDEQASRYGRYTGEPSREQLERHFHLDDHDLELVRLHRADHTRLGYAAQLATVRFLGTFLPDPLDTPPGAVAHLARQLGVEPGVLTRYARRPSTAREHALHIRAAFGYRDYADPTERLGLLRFLYGRAWLTAEGPSVLFDLATARLVERKVVLPGVTTLAREVARVRERADQRAWRVLARGPNAAQRAALEALLQVPDGSRTSMLDQLRKGPASVSAPGLLAALKRVGRVRDVGVRGVPVAALPTHRLAALERYGLAARAQQLAYLRPERRVATLLVTVLRLEVDAVDDALDLLDELLIKVGGRVEREGTQRRLGGLPELNRAALTLRGAVLAALEGSHPDLEGLMAAMFRAAPRERLLEAARAVLALTRPPEDTRAEDLVRRYSLVRQFLPTLLSTVGFEATPAGQPTLDAWRALAALEGRKRIDADEVPLAVVTGAWRALVVKAGDLDRPAYTLCVLEKLREALRRREVFVPGSRRFDDPRARLLSGPAWEARRAGVCRSLGLDPDPKRALDGPRSELDQTYRNVAARLARNAALTVGPRDPKAGHRPSLAALEPLEEPETLKALRSAVSALLPRVDLPELLLEVDAWTGFAEAFTHLSEANARLGDLVLSVVAVLTAEACNVGLEPVVSGSSKALTRGRLSYVDQNYVRAETLAAANARLVDHQARVPLAQAWGGGRLASVDGLRFKVPVQSASSGPNPKYFGLGRGVTYLNYVNDQASGFHAIVVPGTLRDSLFILDGLLEQTTALRPNQVMSDTHSYTDVVFGLFRLLGYQFSPRLADLEDRRFWRLDKEADYGGLNNLSRHPLNPGLVEDHWDDILRVAGSLLARTVRASDLVRVLQGDGRPTALGRAIAEFGRVPKTVHLLNYLDDEGYRRAIRGQLNLHESRHALGRAVFHGQKGELRQRYREGMEDQLGALGLVVNAIVLWNTVYSGLALERLRAQGTEVRDEDVARLSPLGHEHVNLLGRYQFQLDEGVRRGGRRALREPGMPEAGDG